MIPKQVKVLLVFFLVAFLFINVMVPVSLSPADTIEWHPSLTKGTTLAWKITQFNHVGGASPAMGNQTLALNDVIKLKLADNLPNDPSLLYGVSELPASLEFYHNDAKVTLDLSNPEDADMAGMFIAPVRLVSGSTEKNTTEIFMEVAPPSVSFVIDGNYLIMNRTENNITAIVKMNENTGILKEVSFDELTSDNYMKIELDRDSSDIDDEGNAITANGFPSPGFTILSLSLGMLVVIAVTRKKNDNRE
ncbi:MAG: hypothetical protein ACFFD4_00375 [Candidatus Odinarchaeota archaeon]